MTIRTSEKIVTFRRPFILGRSDEVLPAGNYTVETDEKPLEGISFLAYRRILTLIHLHAKPGQDAGAFDQITASLAEHGPIG